MAQELFMEPRFDVQVTDGIVYGTAPINSPPGNVDLLLDLYEPVGAHAPSLRPGFVIIHGGAWVGGSRKEKQLVALATEMATRGYTAVSIDYRLKGQEPVISEEFKPLLNAFKNAGFKPLFARAVTAAIEDATQAHRWMEAQAESLKVDTHRIAVGGNSAGAITSLGMTYMLDDHGITKLPGIGVVMDLSGGLFGFVDCMETKEPSLLIVHGEEDNTVGFGQAIALKERATEVGIPFEFHPLPGIGHGIDIFTIEVEPGVTVFDRVVHFFYEQLSLSDLVLDLAVQTLMDAVDAINALDPSDLKNKNHKKTLTSKIHAVHEMIHAENYKGARNKLWNDIRKKMDGCAKSGYPDKNDWIITCGGQIKVYPLISMVIDLLDDLIGQSSPVPVSKG
jgi:acetyl esterase/lipase